MFFWEHDSHYLMHISSVRNFSERTAKNLQKHIETFTRILTLSGSSEEEG
jgi:hypothetical protein